MIYNVTIRLPGCERITVIDTDVTEQELKFLHRLEAEAEVASTSACMPRLVVKVNAVMN